MPSFKRCPVAAGIKPEDCEMFLVTQSMLSFINSTEYTFIQPERITKSKPDKSLTRYL